MMLGMVAAKRKHKSFRKRSIVVKAEKSLEQKKRELISRLKEASEEWCFAHDFYIKDILEVLK